MSSSRQQRQNSNSNNEDVVAAARLWKPNGKRLGKLRTKLLSGKLLSPGGATTSRNGNNGDSNNGATGGNRFLQYNLATGENEDNDCYDYDYGDVGGGGLGGGGSYYDDDDSINDSEHLLSAMNGMDYQPNTHVVATWQEHDDVFFHATDASPSVSGSGSIHSSVNGGGGRGRRTVLLEDDVYDGTGGGGGVVGAGARSGPGGGGGGTSSSNYNSDVHWWMTPQFDPNNEREVAVTKLQEQIAQLQAERDQLKVTVQTQEQQLFDALATKMNLAMSAGALSMTPSTAATTTCVARTPDSKDVLNTTNRNDGMTTPAYSHSPFVSHSAAAVAAFAAGDDDDVFDFFGLMMEDSESGSNNNNNIIKRSGSLNSNSRRSVASENCQTPEQITYDGFPVAAATTAAATPNQLFDDNFDFHNNDNNNNKQKEDVGGDDYAAGPELDNDKNEDGDEVAVETPVLVEDAAVKNGDVPRQVDIGPGHGNDDTAGPQVVGGSVRQCASTIEIDGISLLDERDHLDNPHRPLTGATVQQYKDLKHLMTFNALQLITKQKKWLDAMSGKKSPASMISIKIELENLERKIRAPEDNDDSNSKTEPEAGATKEDEVDGVKKVDLSGETAQLEAAVQVGKAKAEGTKVPFVPMEPSKAMFKAMSLLDDSLSHFQKGCMKGFTKMNQLVKALKEDVDQLEARNAALNDDISLLHKQQQQQAGMNKALLTSLTKLKAERDAYASSLEKVEKKLSSMAPQSGILAAGAVTSEKEEEKKEDEDDEHGKIGASVMSKVARVQEYIEMLKVNADAENELESELASITQQASGDSGASDERSHVVAGLRKHIEQLTKTNESLVAQHASEKLELRSNLEASWKQVNHLTASLAERNSSIATFVQETSSSKERLATLEEDNKSLKAVADEKSQLLLTATSRIDVLQEELLRVEEELRVVEMDYAEYKHSAVEDFRKAESQWSEELQLTKSQHEESRLILEEKLISVESEHERMVRDLKAAITEIESERDHLKSQVSSLEKMGELSEVCIDKIEKVDSVEDLEDQFKHEDQMASFQSKMAHKAASQANLIAQLQHENDLKDMHMKEMKDLIEHLSERQGGLNSLLTNAKGRQWGSLISKISDRSTHGSQHGN